MALNISDIRFTPAVEATPSRTLQPAPATAAIAATGRGGTQLPGAGKDAPPAAATTLDLGGAIANLNRFLQDSRRDFEFRLDKGTGRTVITIVNPSTGEVVRQIPSEAVLAAAERLRKAGSLLDTSA